MNCKARLRVDFFPRVLHRNGGILLWVRTADQDRETLAVKILKGHSGRDVHVHDRSEQPRRELINLERTKT